MWGVKRGALHRSKALDETFLLVPLLNHGQGSWNRIARLPNLCVTRIATFFIVAHGRPQDSRLLCVKIKWLISPRTISTPFYANSVISRSTSWFWSSGNVSKYNCNINCTNVSFSKSHRHRNRWIWVDFEVLLYPKTERIWAVSPKRVQVTPKPVAAIDGDWWRLAAVGGKIRDLSIYLWKHAPI